MTTKPTPSTGVSACATTAIGRAGGVPTTHVSSENRPALAPLTAVRVQHNPLVVALATLPWLGLLWGAPDLTFTKAALQVVMMLGAAGIGAMGYVLRRRPFARRTPVTVTERGVLQGGTLVARRGEGLRGAVAPRAEKKANDLVLLRCEGAPDLRLEVSSVEEGEAILQRLGLDAENQVATFTMSRFVSPGLLTVGLVAAFMVGGAVGSRLSRTLGGWGALGPAVIMACTVVPMVLMFMPWLIGLSTVDVGKDGLVFRRLGRSRFVPYRDIARVSERELAYQKRQRYPAVALELVDGTTLEYTASRDVRDGFLRRVRKTMAGRGEPGQASVAHRLARGLRSIPDWIRDLRAASEGAVDHRHAALSHDDLHAVLEDVSAPRDLRAAAAVVLARAGSEPSRERVRIAAAATAEPRLRIALTAAADADDAAIEESLAALEEGTDRAPRASEGSPPRV